MWKTAIGELTVLRAAEEDQFQGRNCRREDLFPGKKVRTLQELPVTEECRNSLNFVCVDHVVVVSFFNK